MFVRLVAGLVGLAVLIPWMVFGGVPAIDLLVVAAGLICVDEYVRMAFPEAPGKPRLWIAACVLALFGSAWYLTDRWLVLVSVIEVVGTMIFAVASPGPIDKAADRLGRLFIGIGWIGGCFLFMPLLRRLDGGLAWIFLLLCLAWLSDTGAFFAGRFFGKTKLYEAISPKKTVEGYIGGMLTAVAGVFVVRAVGLPSLTPVDAVVIGTVIGTAGVIGDLAESLLKRAFNVKDSGTIMPGHGGLLDRVDSVLFVAPLLYGYAILIKGF